jgi:hypothetical protein
MALHERPAPLPIDDETHDRVNVARCRELLASTSGVIGFRAWDRAEAKRLMLALTPAERKRVIVTTTKLSEGGEPC